MKIYVAHSTKYGFNEELYLPIKSSNIFEANEFMFPHETDEWINSKEIIKNSDLVLAEVSYPATGLGIELGWADAFDIPVVCIFKAGMRPSSSVSAIFEKSFEYTNSNLKEMLETKII